MKPSTELLADWHMDVLSRAQSQNHDLTQKSHQGHADLPRLRESGFALCGWSLWWSPQSSLIPAQSIQAQIQLALALEKSNQIKIVRYQQDLETLGQGPLHVLLHLEGCQCFENDEPQKYYELGVRSLSLTWNEKNKFATGTGSQNNFQEGLTPQGKNLVRWCREHGVIVDISHLSEGGVADLMNFDANLLVATHANCRFLCDHPRNLSDETIREIGKRGGTIGVALVPSFISKQPTHLDEKLLEHIKRIVDLAGPQSISAGGDLDGTDLPGFIRDVGDWAHYLRQVSQTIGSHLFLNNMVRVLKDTLPSN